jgi:DNA-3-methyladenine glycosylase I
MTMERCPWPKTELDIAYHDTEWGVPVHDDRILFEFLILEGAQAGLSWSTILRKRPNYQRAFANFDPARVARYPPAKTARLLENPGLVRNRLKIESTISNARAFLAVQAEFGSFDAYVWRFVDGRPRQNGWRSFRQIPSRTRESDALSKDLRRSGFRFVGSTICYAFMQAVGLVNDHLPTCFRYPQLREADDVRSHL